MTSTAEKPDLAVRVISAVPASAGTVIERPEGSQPLGSYRNADQRYVIQSVKITPSSGVTPIAVYLVGLTQAGENMVPLWNPEISEAAAWPHLAEALTWEDQNLRDDDETMRVLPRSMGKHGGRKIERSWRS